MANTLILKRTRQHHPSSASSTLKVRSLSWPSLLTASNNIPVVAGISILYAIIFLFPFMSSFFHWPADLILFVLWMVAFGLLANFIDPVCGSIWDWNGITGESPCSKFKANLAFCFLASIFFLASAIIVSNLLQREIAMGNVNRSGNNDSS